MILKRDRYYMELAFTVASGSKCIRAQYGSVLVHPMGHLITTGYNGKPAGSCNDYICYREGLPANAPKDNCCLHSESNTLLFAGRERSTGATLYVTGVPCNDCALDMMQAQIARLVYWAGPTSHGHQGCVDEAYWLKYGSPIVRCAYTQEAWDRR